MRLLALTHLSTRYFPREVRDEARATFPATVVPRDFDAIVVPFPERGEPALVKAEREPAADRALIRHGARRGGRMGGRGPWTVDQRIEQLERDLAEAIERQAATSQVLEAIGRGASELEPGVRDRPAPGGPAVPRRRGADLRARRRRLLGGLRARGIGRVPRLPPQRADRAGPGTLVGRVGQERRTVQIRDVLADRDYRMHRARELGGFRTIFGVPMLEGDRVVGVIILWREQVAPFDARTIELVTTFAAQGAIAIGNVELLLELRRRERELARSVDELRALGEISQAVGSTLDLGEVLTDDRDARGAAVGGRRAGRSSSSSAPRDCSRCAAGTAPARIWWSGCARCASASTRRSWAGPPPGVPRSRPPISEREAPDPHITALLEAGWRSMLAVPLLREDEMIGALIVRRTQPGAFPDRTVELLATLASQSAVAIHNARLYSGREGASWRWRAATSPSSWPRCRTSCGRRSTP